MRAARQHGDLPLLIAQTRQFVAPLRIEFSEEISLPKSGKEVSLVDEWKAKKTSTEQLLALLQTYKDLGDKNSEPLLKNHNPRTFEDLGAPIPNFKTLNLKAGGDVPKFFDAVLSGRASDAVDAKNKWWAARKAEAQAAAQEKPASFAALPVPRWALGQSVSLASANGVTDALVRGLEPARKLALPVIPGDVRDKVTAFAASLGQGQAAPEALEALAKAMAEKAVVTEGGKVLDNFQFISKAVAAKVLAARRAQVHERYVKMWAKKLMVTPEIAAVPLKDVDAQLASKFENVAPKYSELLAAAAAGSTTFGERMKNHPGLESFLLKREKDNIAGDFPPSEAEAAGAALAAQFDDPQTALASLLGPELSLSSAQPLSVQVRAVTAHKYTPERYMYKEGMKLADKLAEEEEALAEELKPVYGASVDVAHFQAHPRSPMQQLADKQAELTKRAAELAAERESATNAFMKYAVAKRQQVTLDPSNLMLEEVQYPKLQEELLDIELGELKEAELKIDDAEEEELWLLTLSAMSKHLSKHFGIDVPHSVLAHMDPVLFKKVDWETTNGLDDWDITLDDMGADGAKEQWALESLSHHFLPLLRYRRAKARKQAGQFDNELC